MCARRYYKGNTEWRDLLVNKKEQWPRLGGATDCEPVFKKPSIEYKSDFSCTKASDDEDLKNTITQYLSELKHDTVVDSAFKLISVPIDSEEKLYTLVRIVFETAVGKPDEFEMYAELCEALKDFQVKVDRNVIATFRKVLVYHCQCEFEGLFPWKKDPPVILENIKLFGFFFDVYKSKEAEKNPKNERTVMFLGHLFKFDLLTPKIMCVILNKLLCNKGDAWDCLCSLLLLVGADMEKRNQDLTTILLTMQSNGGGISVAIQEKLNHVIACRRNKWQEINVPTASQRRSEEFTASGTMNNVRLDRSVWRAHMYNARDYYNME